MNFCKRKNIWRTLGYDPKNQRQRALGRCRWAPRIKFPEVHDHGPLAAGTAGTALNWNILKSQAGWMTVFALPSGTRVASFASRLPNFAEMRSPNTCGKRMISTLKSAVVTGVAAAADFGA